MHSQPFEYPASTVVVRGSTLRERPDQVQRVVNAVTEGIAKIKNDLRVNGHELKVAKHNLKASQRVIAQRLVTLYTSDQASTLEVVLGARSLDDMITRMDSAKSVTGLDAPIPGSLMRQTMFFVADHSTGSPFSALTPRPPGPRNCGQSAPTAVPTPIAPRSSAAAE